MKESLISEWLNRIVNILFYACMLFVTYLIIQIFVVTSFKISSDSMDLFLM